MILARVCGTVVATIKHPSFAGHKLLLCEALDAYGTPTGAQRIAVDRAQAGVGDVVLLLDEGTGARQILGVQGGPVRTLVVAVVDDHPGVP
jgi:microcompartment protein CcmK/EutM